MNQIEQQSRPLKSEKVSRVRTVIGWGITRLTDDFVDFKMEGDRILTENDSKWRSQLMTGGLINLHEFKNKNTIDIAANMEFTVGGKYVDGFFIGGGFGFAHKLEFIFGYSLGRGTELSHGFQRAMGQFIKKHKRDRRFPEFEGLDLVDGVIADIKDYDGLPISYIRHGEEEKKIFPGDAIINSFNSKWSFGVLIPLDIWKLIKKAAVRTPTRTHLPQKRTPAIRNNQAVVTMVGHLLMGDRTRSDILVVLARELGWGGPLDLTVPVEELLD